MENELNKSTIKLVRNDRKKEFSLDFPSKSAAPSLENLQSLLPSGELWRKSADKGEAGRALYARLGAHSARVRF